MYECNIPRLFFIKYGPLIFGLIILGIISRVIMVYPGTWTDILFASTPGIIFSFIFFFLFFNYKDKVKYVAIGKSKIIIKKKGQEIEYNWVDVESITLNRFWGTYTLKIKNEDEIYFPTYGNFTWLTGDESDLGVMVDKMKRELQI